MVVAISASAVMKRQDAFVCDGGVLGSCPYPNSDLTLKEKEKKHWLGFNPFIFLISFWLSCSIINSR